MKARNYGSEPKRKSARNTTPVPVQPKGKSKPAGPGRPRTAASPTVGASSKKLSEDAVLSEAAKTVWQLNVQLVHLRSQLKDEHRQRCILEGYVESVKAAVAHCHGNLEEMSENEAKVIMGEGYGDLESESVERLIRLHVTHVLEAVKEKAGTDGLKAAQLSQAVARRLSGQVLTGGQAGTDELALAHELVFNALNDYFGILRDAHKGRYPDAVRVAYQAIMSALGGCLPPGSIPKVAKALQVPEEQLYRGKRHWAEYKDAEHPRTQPYDLHGAATTPYNEEWAEFVVHDCLLHDDFTRPSEQAKDKLHNPHTKSDPELRSIRWLEMSLKELLNEILKKGKAHFKKLHPMDSAEFTISSWKLRELMRHEAWEVKRAGREVCLCRYHLQWDLYVAALYGARKKVRDAKAFECTEEELGKNIRSGMQMRRRILCDPPDGQGTSCIK